MRILMLGNSFTSCNSLPDMVASLTGAEVVAHTRGGARLSEQYNPNTAMGKKTLAALENEKWDYVVIQGMSKGPVISENAFRRNVKKLCELSEKAGAKPVLYATWAYEKGSAAMEKMDMSYDEMYQRMCDIYHQAAEENNALVADAGKAFYDNADRIKLYLRDGKHPGRKGTELAAKAIADVIRGGKSI